MTMDEAEKKRHLERRQRMYQVLEPFARSCMVFEETVKSYMHTRGLNPGPDAVKAMYYELFNLETMKDGINKDADRVIADANSLRRVITNAYETQKAKVDAHESESLKQQ